jgi:hypothetical protein
MKLFSAIGAPFSADALGCLFVVTVVICWCVLKVIELDRMK